MPLQMGFSEEKVDKKTASDDSALIDTARGFLRWDKMGLKEEMKSSQNSDDEAVLIDTALWWAHVGRMW